MYRYKSTFGILLASAIGLACAMGAHTPTPVSGSDNIAQDASQLEDRRTPTREPFRVLTWNMEHFVDPYDDPYVDNIIEDAGGWKSEEDHLLIAKALKLMNADVMALQEVESDRQVKLFLDTYWPDHGYKYFAGTPDIEWYQNVVIASRFPIGEIVSLREVEMYNTISGATENKYNNRLLFAEIMPREDYSFFMACLHLKAGRSDVDIEWRKLQTALVQNTIHRRKAWDENVNIMVTGDMNFMFNTEEYDKMVNGGPVKLHDLMEEWNTEPIIRNNPRNSRIDHIFINGNMHREYVEGSAGLAQPLSFYHLVRVSDHFPFVASFYPEDL